MANYTKEEIKAFAEKDLRISKIAIVKSLIEKLTLEDVYGVTKIKELTGRYVDIIYARQQKGGDAGDVASTTEQIDWKQTAVGLNLATPNSENVKMLDLIFNEHKKANKASANPAVAGMTPADVLVHIINTFGRYPETTEGVKIVVESLN